MTNNKIAGQERRFLNLVIDMFTIAVLWFLLTIVLLILGFDQTIADESGEELPLIPIIILIPTFWGYYILAEYKFQRTVGKLLSRTRVVSLNGDKPTLNQIVIRTLSRSIPFEYFSYLSSAEGLHDKFSKTRVVQK